MIRRQNILVLSFIILLVGCVHSSTSFGADAEPQPGPRYSRHAAKYVKNNAQMKALVKPVVAQAAGATVRILCDDRGVALGTVVAADGLVATKASQLSGKIECRLPGGRKLPATLVGQDDATDLALLRIDAKDLTPVTWAAAAPAPGSIVVATGPSGDPLALGVVSDTPRAMIGPRGQTPPHGWLGIGIGTDNNGAQVQSVSTGSAAEKAGLKTGDRIKRVDSRDVRSADELIDSLSKVPANKRVSLLVDRQERQLEIEAILGSSPGSLPEDGWGGGPFSDRRWGFSNVISHDLAIAPSDCGGPLVDIDGRCLGINIARALRATSYALPSNVVQETIAKLKTKEKKAP